MTYTPQTRPVVSYQFKSIELDKREPQWWMRSQRRGLMMADSGVGAIDSQSGDF